MKDKFETGTGGEMRDNGCQEGIYTIVNSAISRFETSESAQRGAVQRDNKTAEASERARARQRIEYDDDDDDENELADPVMTTP